MPDLELRPETSADRAGVRRVVEAAFAQPQEADLVEALHAAGAVRLSMVAERAGEVIAHVLFSPVEIHGEAGVHAALGLAPMAVLPEHQRSGVGTALVRASMTRLKSAGQRLVVVLGHPTYYPRFGFVPARTLGITCEYDVPDDVFMVCELVPGALLGVSGTARYHEEFKAF